MRRARALFGVAVAVLLIAAVARFDVGEGAVGPMAGPPFPEVGSLAPDFALQRLQPDAPYVGADTLRLSDFAGRYVYVDVFGSWCPPCRLKYPAMREIADSMRALGGEIVGVLLNDSPEAAAAYFAENGGMAYPFALLDEETRRSWEVTGAPMGFLIDPDGRVQRRCWGCARGPWRTETLLSQVEQGLEEP